MSRSRVVLASIAVVATVAAVVFAALYFRGEPATTTRTVVERPCGDRIFGHISSLQRRDGKLELRFDPAWFTSGVTANTAAAEDGAVDPGQPVPNDNYVVEEGHRLLTYYVGAHAHIGVLAKSKPGVQTTPITVSELERIVNGRKHRPLFEPLASGVWIRVHIDTVCSLDQQYRP
jgi:hypothetical protein